MNRTVLKLGMVAGFAAVGRELGGFLLLARVYPTKNNFCFLFA
jgi:hypothetical protein